MSELESFREKINKNAFESEHKSMSMSDYCKLHPEDPVCQSYRGDYPRMQSTQPPETQDEDRGEQIYIPEPEPEPEPEPVKPEPEKPEYPPKPQPDEGDYTVKPDQPSEPDNGEDFRLLSRNYRSPRGALDMWSKSCPRCGATLPAGTNFCPRCGDIVEKIVQGTGGKGGPSGSKGGPSQ